MMLAASNSLSRKELCLIDHSKHIRPVCHPSTTAETLESEHVSSYLIRQVVGRPSTLTFCARSRVVLAV